MTNVVKGIGRGARQMVRFPGPFTKKGKKKRARANEQQDTPRSGYSSAEEATDFYSDLEEARCPALHTFSCSLIPLCLPPWPACNTVHEHFPSSSTTDLTKMGLQESRSPARAPPPGLAQATLLDNAQSDASERASVAAAGTCSSLFSLYLSVV